MFDSSHVIVTIIGLMIPIIGWKVNAKLDKAKIDQLRKEAKTRKYYDNQLRNLYGPIFSLQRKSKAYFNTLLDKFGRNILIPPEGLSEEEIVLLNHYTEEYFLPVNKEILNIIEDNAHLFPAEEYPKSFKFFIDYTCKWESMYYSNKKSKKYEYIPPPNNYPKSFEKEIKNKMSYLKERQWKIISNYDVD